MLKSVSVFEFFIENKTKSDFQFTSLFQTPIPPITKFPKHIIESIK